MHTKFSVKQIIQNIRSHIKVFLILMILFMIIGLVYNFYISKDESETLYSKSLIVYVESETGDGYYVANSINSFLYESMFTDPMIDYCMKEARNIGINLDQDEILNLSTHTISSNSNYLKITTKTELIEQSNIIINGYKYIINSMINDVVGNVEIKYVEGDVVKSTTNRGYNLDKALLLYCIISICITTILFICYSFYKTLRERQNNAN